MTPQGKATIALVIILILIYKFPMVFVLGLGIITVLALIASLWKFLYILFEQ